MYSGNISRLREGSPPRQWGATSFCRFDFCGRSVLSAQTGLQRSPLAVLIERWFTDRLMKHRGVSSNTIASYRDTFRLLFAFAQTRLAMSPSQLTLRDLDAPFVGAFLEHLETKRAASVRTRNLRLTAIRSFFRYAAFEEPTHSAHIQRVLAIPSKRCDKRQLQFLTRPEIESILDCTDRSTWLGRRDYTLLC